MSLRLVSCVLWLAACSRATAPSPAVSALRFETTLGAENPLVGTVYDVRAKQRISFDELLSATASAQFVLLGEQHNNPDHHALQARIYGDLAAHGRKLGLVFEMFGRDDQAMLNEKSLDAMAKVFSARGWEGWQWYAPIAQVALGAGQPIVGGDLDAVTLAEMRKGGLAALSDAEKQRLGVTAALPDELRQPMGEEMVVAHCGHGTPEQFSGMVDIQFARDASLAKALEDTAAGRDGAVLVSGAGHSRTDRGAPWHLRQRQPGSIVSVAFVEVQDGVVEPLDYTRAGEVMPYDFVIFTPRASDDDPCAAFKKAH